MRLGSSQDPIARFGKDSARLIMRRIRALPAKDRTAVIRDVLDSISPGLSADVERKTVSLKSKHSSASALEKAIAIVFSNRIADDIMAAGGGHMPLGFAGLAGCCDGYEDVEGLLGDVWDGVKDAGKAVGRTGEAVGRGVYSAGSTAVRSAYTAGRTVVNEVGELYCAAMTPGNAAIVGGVVASAYGAPPQVGAQGGQIAGGVAQRICGRGGETTASPPLPSGSGFLSGLPPWALPAALGGAVLLIVLSQRRK